MQEDAVGGLTAAMALVIAALVTVVVVYRCFFRYGPVLSTGFKLFGINKPPFATVVGYTAPDFETLRDLLKVGFESGDDLGCQFAAYVDGILVADIATGFTDRSFTVPYTQDTLQLVFSTSKVITCFVFMHLVNTNRLALSDLMSKYWPEFAAGNKANVTIGDFLAHRGGVAYLDKERVPTPEDLLDLDSLASKLAEQPHNFDGKTVSAYHAVTRGWYLNEIVRRVTSGKTVRDIMYEEILPLINERDLESGEDKEKLPGESSEAFQFHYGIPLAPAHVAKKIHATKAQLDGYSFVQKAFYGLSPRRLLLALKQYPVPPSLIKAYFSKGSIQNLALMASGPDFSKRPVRDNPWCYNDPVLLASSSPSFSGITNARSLVRLAELVRNSGKNGNGSPQGLVSRAVFEESLKPIVPMEDKVLLKMFELTQCGLGMQKIGFGAFDTGRVGEGLVWYGGAGTGGSVLYFELEYNITFCFTMNFLHLQSTGDKRSWRLIEELVRIVKLKKMEENSRK
ncbi:hypothetical protein HK100_004247 [Physocladia obscura]|uniref:Beta-lactamase-related domain-containing protein n=1 Tax=Physocladia obscura TaxID=109957 RepID=A0AAD5XKZ7_9FUNG|nr:hypothetical protein HK100_004247 [Physocladia obscura]